MAKLTGPLLSFGARGQIGKTMVASSWRGIATARQYVIPANPQTTAQQTNRTRFAFFRELWKRLPSAPRDAFDTYAVGRKFTGMNAFVGENNRLAVGETDLSTTEMSPGTGGALPPIAVVASTGSSTGEVDVAITEPDQLPDGWTITAWWAVGLPDQDPTGILNGRITQGTDADPANPITLDGFDASDEIQCYGFIEYQTAQGKTAYSVSLADTATAAA